MKILIMALLSGLLFGVGLTLGGMTQPKVVLGFLNVFGHWNPRLVLVMGGAVLTTAIGYRWVGKKRKPLLAEAFHWPTRKDIEWRLLGGAALFGMGWGMAGYCPGPALVSIGGGQPDLWAFVVAMAGGWWLAAQWSGSTDVRREREEQHDE
ncbi:YeeE/YedE family protein [Oleiagrimonas sp.]|uniref:YeeE/YedE family protein n=1 Tax=Oleiagrimonas sp. TaxID=2010330 RepID=UPI00260B0F6F|nr:YeeE/YedE family protein [Oleiagrimonas sp.]MDA3914693.1 YeeE/YedE family protein [Oleiagrimonas sp.]